MGSGDGNQKRNSGDLVQLVLWRTQEIVSLQEQDEEQQEQLPMST